jgi:hypothetical protein
MSDPITVTREESLCELRREAALRKNVYRRWVERGTMTEEDSRLHMARLMAAVVLLQDGGELSETCTVQV